MSVQGLCMCHWLPPPWGPQAIVGPLQKLIYNSTPCAHQPVWNEDDVHATQHNFNPTNLVHILSNVRCIKKYHSIEAH